MLCYDYEYDLEKRPFISKKIDSSKPVGQCFLIPEGTDCISGFRVKLSKIGKPGQIEYKIGDSFGKADIAHGYIDEDGIVPFYEMFYGDNFAKFMILPKRQYFLWLKPVSGMLPDDGYRIYGPHPGEKSGYSDDIIDMAHWQSSFDSVSYPKYIYQEGLPQYEDGYGVDECGEKTWSMAFQILTGDECITGAEEERFECIRRLTSLANCEWKNIRSGRAPEDKEVELGSDWHIVYDGESTVISNVIEDFKDFCNKCMGFSPDGVKNAIKLLVDDSLDYCEEESRISVEAHSIEILSKGERGIMRALYLLEDIMRYRKAPFFKLGTFTYKPKYGLRITKGIYSDPYQCFELEEPDIYTEGYLRRISRAGYNAIWLLINIEQVVVDSSVFPEMNDEKASLVIRRLKELTEKAGRYGIDIYFEARTWHYKPFDTSLYIKHPEIRSYDQWNTALTSPCSSSRLVLDFYNETLCGLFKSVPKLKGMLLIYDTEGFYTCFMRGQNFRCEHCKDKDSVLLASSFMKKLSDAVRVGNESRKLILWTYATLGDWSIKVLEGCSNLNNVVMMGCMNQFADIERFGVRSKIDDYAVCVSKASDYFEKLSGVSGRLRMPIIAKIEDAFGQEFVNTPYMFTLQQCQKKWDEFHRFKCLGFMANYCHYGFYPGPCADLMKLNCFSVSGTDQFDSEDYIRIAITQNYGEEAYYYLERASQSFSTAMCNYFPYSPGVCRYPGPIQSAPSQPFYLDDERTVRRQRARGNVQDLSWTLHKGWEFVNLKSVDLWDDKLVYKCFESFNREYREGIQQLKNALRLIDSRYLSGLLELIDIAETHAACVETMINFINFIHLREEYKKERSPALGAAIKFLLEKELSNAKEMLRICSNNSTIGFTGSGNGNVRAELFNPFTIREKIIDLQEEILKL